MSYVTKTIDGHTVSVVGPTPEALMGKLSENNITLRDYFAAKAMQAWLVGVDNPNIGKCAAKAYEIADTMLEARK
jgi:hypothetical protein